jgi:hypothetical protein
MLMAFATLDFEIRPEDGWVLVATNPNYLKIRPVEHHPYWIAVTAAGVPAADLEGLKYGRGGDAQRQDFDISGVTAGLVYIRVKEPPNSAPSSHMHFGVLRDQ